MEVTELSMFIGRLNEPYPITTLATVAQHVLVFFLVFIGPVWDYVDTRRLKVNSSSIARLGYYRRTILWLWIFSFVALWCNGWQALFTLQGLGIQVAWLQANRWLWWLVSVVLGLAVVVQLILPVIQVAVKYRKRPYVELRQLEPLRYFLPATIKERRWFAALSVTAGFCEELLFRGFLLRYLHTWPLHVDLLWAVLIASVVFGLYHIYQGQTGILTATFSGLVFTAILLVTGNLVAGMIYHALVDLSILLYWRPKTLYSEDAQFS